MQALQCLHFVLWQVFVLHFSGLQRKRAKTRCFHKLCPDSAMCARACGLIARAYFRPYDHPPRAGCVSEVLAKFVACFNTRHSRGSHGVLGGATPSPRLRIAARRPQRRGDRSDASAARSKPSMQGSGLAASASLFSRLSHLLLRRAPALADY